MRLIRTRAPYIELAEIGEEQVHSQGLRYAILSHRWGNDKVTFQDAVDPSKRDKIGTTEGYRKIKSFCTTDAPDYEYAWVDTCCINKESSAELSEAINSMYRWYQRAGICYAYLNDVSSCTGESQLHAEIERSQWFTRGWNGISATDDASIFTSMKYRNRLSRLLGAASLDTMAQLFPPCVIDVLGRSVKSVVGNRYRRKIPFHHHIHQAVLDRMIEFGYRPGNLREHI